MRALIIGLCLLTTPALAQAPAAGSGAGGPVGASTPGANPPQGSTPPGAATGPVRDAIGTAVIGKTETPPSLVPGNTGGKGSGVQK